MNNQMPFFYPFQPFYNPQINQSDFDKLLSKVEKLENDLNSLEKRLIKLEKQDTNYENNKEDNQDMHFI